jgi:diadenylate cyclase
MLSKISRPSLVIIENSIDRFEELPMIVRASVEDLDDVEGIGELRARKIKDGLQFLKEQLFAD